MANYYRKFVKNFSALAAPLHELTKKGRKFEMTSETRIALENIKSALTTAPVLIHPNYSKALMHQFLEWVKKKDHNIHKLNKSQRVYYNRVQ